MTRDHPLDGEITTEEEFEAALDRLLAAASRNGVDPRGSWVSRNGETAIDWEIMIHELRDGGD